MTTPELAPRYAPGEDAGPLVRSLAGGVLGTAAALVVDRALAPMGGPPWVLPWVLAGRVFLDPSAIEAGVALLGALNCAAALLFTYGQVRRFVPGRPWLKGVACAAVAWAVLAPALLGGLNVGWADAAFPEAVAVGAGVLGRTLVAVLVSGAVMGTLNPPRDG